MDIKSEDIEVIEYSSFKDYNPSLSKDVNNFYDPHEYSTGNFFFLDWNYQASRVTKSPPDGKYLVDRVIVSPYSLHSLSWRKWKDCTHHRVASTHQKVPSTFLKCPILEDNMVSYAMEDLRRDALAELERKLGRHVPMVKGRILYVARGVGHRRIKNEADVIEALRKEFSDSNVKVIDPTTLSYLEQVLSFLESELIIGMHGGGTWNAARWMCREQSMVEILPHLGPGQAYENVLMMGAGFESLLCSECVPENNWVGNIDIQDLIRRCRKLLARNAHNY